MFFKMIRKNEFPLLILLFVVSIILNVLYLYNFYGVYYPIISGYDPYLLSTVTEWTHSPYIHSNSIFSHPGFSIIALPIAIINALVSFFVGSNCANFILSIILMFMYVTEVILLKRILEDYVGLNSFESVLLSVLFGFMAYVLLMSFTPDHFAFSQFFLILYIFLWTKRESSGLHKSSLFLPYIVVCGITITNGIKILLSLLFFKGRFLRYLFFTIIILFATVCIPRILNSNVIYSTNPGESAYLAKEYVNSVNNKHFYFDEKEIEGKYNKINFSDCEKSRNEALETLVVSEKNIEGNKVINKIKSIYWGYLYWVKGNVSKYSAFIYNMFGESVLLHKNSINKESVSFGSYSSTFVNIVNYVFIIMVFCGIVVGCKERLMKLLAIFLSVDFLLHIIVGYGINEVYIFSPHYLFIFIISIGYLIKKTTGYWTSFVLLLTLLVSAVCMVHNVLEIYRYMI